MSNSNIDIAISQGTPVDIAISQRTVVNIEMSMRGPAGEAGEGIPTGGTTGQVLAKNSNTNYDTEWIDAAGLGDMLKSVYDMNNDGVVDDAEDSQLFSGSNPAYYLDTDNHTDGTTNKVFTAIEQTKLSGIEASADVTDAGNVGSSIHGTTAKTTPIDADTMPLIDSAASNVLKKVTWANVKATLKTYFDTLYNLYVHPNHSGDVTSVADGATTIDKTAITGKTAVTAVGTDYILISDTSDTGNLKKALASDLTGAGSVAWGSVTGTLSSQTDLQTALDTKVDENVAITGATKTKVTYDAKGLVTSGADATTADIADSTNKRYVTDANLTVIGNTSGTNTGDNATNTQYSGLVTNATHTGDVTGSDALTIANDAVTNAKAANMAANTIKGRITASTGDPEDLTAANVRTIINVADGANAYTHPNHSGDVTSVADGAQTIANDAVTYAKMQNVSATDKVLGRSTAGSGDVEEIACTAAGRAIIDDATAADQRTTLGLGTAATTAATAYATAAQGSTADAALPAASYDDATAAETTTGTSTAKYVSPDGLAGSDYGKRIVGVLVSDPLGDAITTGDSKAHFRIPSSMNGWNLIAVAAHVSTVSSSGVPTVQIRRSRRSSATARTDADMLSTKLTIDASEFDSIDATAAAVIDTANDDVATGDVIHIDIDVAGTGTKGLFVEFTLQLP